jgi:peptidoglycan-associated lipoprotein
MKIPLILLLFAALIGCRPIRHDRVRIVDPPPPPPPEIKTEPQPAELLREELPAPEPLRDPSRSDAKAGKTEPEAVRELNDSLQDAFFAYDRSDLSAGAGAALQHDAELLRRILADFPALKITVEGHCDDRGSAEYNLGLGDRRARQAADVLRNEGVPEANLEIVSYGKEAPQCVEAAEPCRQLNRRVHLRAIGTT